VAADIWLVADDFDYGPASVEIQDTAVQGCYTYIESGYHFLIYNPSTTSTGSVGATEYQMCLHTELP